MERIERAIRNALAKADAANSEIRQRVYTSVWQAHERALAPFNESDRKQRREQLTQTIRQIETEYAAAYQKPAQPVSNHDLNTDWAPSGETRNHNHTPDIDPPLRKSMHDDDTVALGPASHGKIKSNKKQPKKRSLITRLTVPVILVLTCAIVGISLYNSLSDIGRAPNNGGSAPVSLAPFKEGANPDDAHWITIFTPQDATRISVTGTATAEITRVEGLDYLRIKSPSPKDTIKFDVGEGILNQFANTTATFDIIARSSDGKPAQMSVTCDFGDMGNCQRRRYDVTPSQSDFLFEVDFPANKKAQKSGTISINSDLGGTGRAVDIIAIRVGKPE
ncbi:hypothetical protein ACLBWZ_15925 [Brucellaceae bacterium C25G]